MTWALVPPTPKELTPARRGRSARGHGCRLAVTWKGVRAKSIDGLGALKCAVGGICSWCRASAVLMRPAAPAAVTMWPTLLLSRAERAVAERIGVLGVGHGQRLDLDRVAHRRGGAVRLDVRDAAPHRRRPPPARRGSPRPGRRRWAR